MIGVDEGQFFPDVTQFCEDMANMGKMVLVAALDGTFQGRMGARREREGIRSPEFRTKYLEMKYNNVILLFESHTYGTYVQVRL